MYLPHPAAQVFPLMEGDAFAGLVADVKARGLVHAIVTHEGKILDGRNRQRACEAADVVPHYTPYLGDDPIGYVVSVNLARRHMNESQRSIVAAKLATLPQGVKQTGKSAALTQSDAAQRLNVGERTVRDAKSVLDRGTPEVVAAVEQGDLAVSRAAEIARLSHEQQRDELAALKAQPVRRDTAEQRDRWMSREIRLTEAEIRGLVALCALADEQGEPLAREGARVVRKLAPILAVES